MVSKEMAIIVDLDGTLSVGNHSRGWYDEGEAIMDDEVCTPVLEVMNAMRISGYKIVLMSGRKEGARYWTQQWLLKHGIYYHHLYMRDQHDNRHDNITKEELYRNHVEPHYDILFCLDDRNQVVDMWRRIGLKCLQVAEGDF